MIQYDIIRERERERRQAKTFIYNIHIHIERDATMAQGIIEPFPFRHQSSCSGKAHGRQHQAVGLESRWRHAGWVVMEAIIVCRCRCVWRCVCVCVCVYVCVVMHACMHACKYVCMFVITVSAPSRTAAQIRRTVMSVLKRASARDWFKSVYFRFP